MCVFFAEKLQFWLLRFSSVLARTARELIVRWARRATRDKRDTQYARHAIRARVKIFFEFFEVKILDFLSSEIGCRALKSGAF